MNQTTVLSYIEKTPFRQASHALIMAELKIERKSLYNILFNLHSKGKLERTRVGKKLIYAISKTV